MAAPPDLAALPKAEVHIHLEGSVRSATLEEFSARAGISVPTSFDSLNSFVESFALAWSMMSSPGDYGRLVREYCEDVARVGVRYAELEMTTIGRSYDCMAEAVEAASRQSDVVVRFVVGLSRNLPVEIAWAMLEAAKDVPDVVAIGLGGPEAVYPPEPFREVFEEARRRGLHSAPHAGEDAGVEWMRGALDALEADACSTASALSKTQGSSLSWSGGASPWPSAQRRTFGWASSPRSTSTRCARFGTRESSFRSIRTIRASSTATSSASTRSQAACSVWTARATDGWH